MWGVAVETPAAKHAAIVVRKHPAHRYPLQAMLASDLCVHPQGLLMCSVSNRVRSISAEPGLKVFYCAHVSLIFLFCISAALESAQLADISFSLSLAFHVQTQFLCFEDVFEQMKTDLFGCQV